MMRDLLQVVGLEFAVADGAEHQADFATFRHLTVALKWRLRSPRAIDEVKASKFTPVSANDIEKPRQASRLLHSKAWRMLVSQR
jgi:hypothetical protein